MEVYPVLDELASNISTLNLEHVRRLKGRLLALTQKVQKVKHTKNPSKFRKIRTIHFDFEGFLKLAGL